jgi:centromeric protein E
VIQDKLRTKEKNEIDRLEKVIEAQKEVIDDQREKIKFWAKVCTLQQFICIDTDVSGA